MTLPLAEQSPEALGEASEVWEAVQELIKPSLSDGSYRMWFADVEARAVDRTALELFAPSDYVRNWLVTHHMSAWTLVFLNDIPWVMVMRAYCLLAGVCLSLFVLGAMIFDSRDLKS